MEPKPDKDAAWLMALVEAEKERRAAIKTNTVGSRWDAVTSARVRQLTDDAILEVLADLEQRFNRKGDGAKVILRTELERRSHSREAIGLTLAQRADQKASWALGIAVLTAALSLAAVLA